NGLRFALHRNRRDLPGRFARRANRSENDGNDLDMLQAVLFFIIVVAGTGGKLSVSRAMKSIGEIHKFDPRSLLRFVGRALRLPWMWIGVSLMTLGFFALIAILSFDDVSFVVPFSALSYIAGALGARILLGERISRDRWVGIAAVTLGVTLVWWSRR